MDKVTFYTTIENQVRNDGSKGLLYDHFDRDDGVMTDGRVFDRRTVPVDEEVEE